MNAPALHMQNDLKLLEQRWGLALQSAGFGVWDLDLIREHVHYSPEWKAMLGYGGADEPEPTSVWRSRVHPDDLQAMVTALTEHLHGVGDLYEKEFRVRSAEGPYRWVLSRGRVVERDAQGRALRMVGTMIDLSDRREAEALRLAYERVEAASRAKTAFLSRMSHELRTPLNAVLGFAQLLRSQIGAIEVEQQRRYVKNIEQAGWHLLGLVDNVLDLSQAEAGQLQMRIEPVALLPLMQGAIDAASIKSKEQVKEQSLQLRLGNLPEEADAVLADAARLRQVLATLLVNAIKFNRVGGSVTLDARACAEGWRLSVIDTGIGIAAQQIPQLFEPFNRSGPTAPGADGVGLGLMLARWLIEAMGGRIAVRSTPGAGATFEVTLPSASSAPR